MNGYPTLLDLIDTRSFSSVWYWIALAVAWSLITYRPVGVPYDMVHRARREGGEADARLRLLARLMAERLLWATRRGGAWLTGLTSALITALTLLGFVYGVELAQAVLLLLLPALLVWWMALRTARRIVADDADAARHLARHRAATQAVGLVAIFVTAVWGMYVNLASGVF